MSSDNILYILSIKCKNIRKLETKHPEHCTFIIQSSHCVIVLI
jgi:hypothetical protein